MKTTTNLMFAAAALLAGAATGKWARVRSRRALGRLNGGDLLPEGTNMTITRYSPDGSIAGPTYYAH
jgi:hypothetical protein